MHTQIWIKAKKKKTQHEIQEEEEEMKFKIFRFKMQSMIESSIIQNEIRIYVNLLLQNSIYAKDLTVFWIY